MNSVSRTASAGVARRPGMSGYKALLLASAMLFVGACSESTPADPIVVGSIEVTPRLTTARVGATQQLAAAAKAADGSAMSGETFVWTSSEKTVATVSASGLVTFVGAGSTAILAKARGTTGFATVVSDANVATMTITASSLSLPLGQTRQISATSFDPSGIALFRPITWTSSAPTVATVSSTGLIVSVSGGTTTITATSEGKTASVLFTIVPPAPVNSVTIAPNTGFLPTGSSVPLTVTLRDVANGVLSNRVVTWTSSNGTATGAVGTGSGAVNAANAGSVVLTATSETKVGTATFTAFTGLLNGAARIFANAVVDGDVYFAVYVPPGRTSLVIAMSGGTGDPDIFTFAPGDFNMSSPYSNWNCRPYANGPNETCTQANPAAGVWVIGVNAYVAHSGTQLLVTMTPAP